MIKIRKTIKMKKNLKLLHISKIPHNPTWLRYFLQYSIGYIIIIISYSVSHQILLLLFDSYNFAYYLVNVLLVRNNFFYLNINRQRFLVQEKVFKANQIE